MTALFTHDDFVKHEVPLGHPEAGIRIKKVLEHFDEVGLLGEVSMFSPDLPSDELILKVHESNYVAALQQLVPEEGLIRLDADTGMGPTTLQAAMRASGAVVSAVKESLTGSHKRGFCLVRPPGHHAERAQLMGFCFFNSIAIAAEYALKFVDRIAILDFDAHHCNGTVEIFAGRPEILVCSSYEYPFYPYRHLDLEDVNLVNTRLEAGTSSLEFRKAIEQTWLRPIEEHKPQLFLVSAGFDAHLEDPLANLNLADEDFQWITKLIVDLSHQFAEGRVVSTLEGGYALEALARSTTFHLEQLL
ncbi:MAG: histone deacetylase family protein [Gammaproteobacteria bacterium]|nr:histone deacetylase family protein [Gammaproteobacteria bacterium]